MSAFFRCDKCSVRVTGTFDADDGRWHPPSYWKSFVLSDWEIHGCCQDHLDYAKEQAAELTPFTTDGIPIDTTPRIPREAV